jgi:hypothetical protein
MDKAQIKDIEIDTLNLKVNFIMENNSVVKNCSLNSECLSDATLTYIFDDLAKVDITKLLNER